MVQKEHELELNKIRAETEATLAAAKENFEQGHQVERHILSGSLGPSRKETRN